MKNKTKIFSILIVVLLFTSSIVPGLVGNANENQEEETPVVITAEENSDGETDVETATDNNVLNEEVDSLANMELISETDSLQLYFNSQTAEIAVKEKANGQVWYSNPKNRELDPVATGDNKGLLNSQLFINHYNPFGQSTRLDTFKDSVAKEQFEYEKTENGVKVIYQFGDTSLGVERIPFRISKERFQTLILDKIEDEKTRTDLEKRFLYVEELDVYERRDGSFPKVVMERTVKLLDEIGYTLEELAKDNEEFGTAEGEVATKPTFSIPVQFELDGNDFIATVNGAELEYNEDYPLASIHLLPYFGAADSNEQGYMFVPDGSGALIHLNNGKELYQPFQAPVYGNDGAVFVREKKLVSEDVRLPVFGMKQGDHGFIAIIEQGDGIASINADVSGRVNNYNYVYGSFTIKESSEITLSGGDRSSTTFIYQKGEYNDNISIRYAFLEADEADYVGMAHYYQQYLVNQFGMQELQAENELPFFLELTGSVWKRKTFLGIPYQSLEPLTTFEEAETIVQTLLDSNIDNIKLRYTGWFNGGVNHKIPSNIKVDGKVGGKNGLADFNEYLNENGVEFYPDVAFASVNDNSWSFSPTRDASRFINKKVAEIYPFNPASSRRDIENRTASYILSPTKLPSVVEDFVDDYKDLNIPSLSLRDLGSQLNSDFRDKKVITREASKEITQQQIEKLAAEFPNILAVGGNALSIPYATTIVNAPMSSSYFNIADESVPFYQIVIHGFADYAGKPINLSTTQNMKTELLKSLETGSNVYFNWFYEDPATVKDTEFNYLYSSNYRVWLEDAVALYEEVNSVLGEVRNQPIIDHKQLQDGVFETTYGSNMSVIVNYNTESVAIDGILVEAEGYEIRQGE